MPFVPDTAPTDAPPRRGFVPDAPAPAPAVPLGKLGAAAVPGADREWAAGRAPEQVAERQRQEAAARNPIRDKVVGAVEGALDIAAKIVGGGVGGVAGVLSTPLAGGSASENMEAGARRGVGVVRDIYRQTHLTSGEEPQTEFGRTVTEGFDTAAANLPPVMGVHGTLQTPAGAGVAARRAVGDTVRAAGDAAMEAATPNMTPQRAVLAEKAIAAGIPINLHQLSDNKMVRIAGETAENLPGAGGGSVRAARKEAFMGAVIRELDPELEAKTLTPDVYYEAHEKVGSGIGGIMGKYDVPKDAFGDLSSVTKGHTPDIKQALGDYITDLNTIADENGGVVPGTTLRELRSQIAQRARETTNGDMRGALGNLVKKLDDGLSEVASDTDLTALTDLRRRYAIGAALEPLIAKSPDGNITPVALMGALTRDKAGKRRMAKGQGGDIGDYARAGQDFLKEIPSSGTAERQLVHTVAGLGGAVPLAVASPMSAGALYAGSALYNFLGPKVTKKLIEAQKRRRTEAPAPEGRPPEPTLGRGFEDVPQRPEPGGEVPLGDLTPEWGTTPGAAPAAAGGMDPAGLVPALGEEAPSTGTRVDMRTRAGQEIPAVPGRPDLPDTLVSGAPAESAATEPANAAMVTPGAIEARRQQGMAAVERAAAAERAEPVPVGEATEITPESVKPAPGMPDEPIPVGEATEITPENVKPAPEVKEHPEVAKIRQDIAKKREAEAKKQAAADELRAAAAAETDPEVKAALIKRADAIAPAKKQEKTDGTPSEPVGTGGVRKEAGQEGVPKDGDAGAQVAKGGEEALDLGLPKIDEGLLDLQQRVTERVSPPPAPSPRDRRQVRRALERGMADGTLNKDGASLALWALDRNENLAHGLRVEVLQPEPGSPAKGSYNSATRIVELFQGNDNPETAMHEILHHSERMMPDAVQQGIYRAWERAVKAEMEGASPERRAAMEALNKVSSNDMTALDSVERAFKEGVLKADDYQFVNPTEYWAVNGARIMHERFTGRGSWRAQARQWMREMIEHVKGTVGIRSDSPLLKALNEMLDPAKTTGAQKSPTMIKNRPEGGGSLTSTKERK